MRPRPAVARIDAAVASRTSSSTTPKIARDLPHAGRRKRNDRGQRRPQPHVVDGHDDLRQQIEEVHERDPDDDGRSTPAAAMTVHQQEHADVVGQRVAAEEQAEVRGSRDAVHDQQAEPEL